SQVVFQLPEAWKYDKEHQPKIARGGTVPFACSGDRYAAVPRMTPTPVIIRGELKVGEFSRSNRCAVCGFRRPGQAEVENLCTMPSRKTGFLAQSRLSDE